MKLFPKGSVLFTKSGMSILLNQRAILARDMYVVSHIGISITLSGVPSELVYYWLKSIDFKNLTHATTLPSLQLTKVKQIPIPLPPLPEQQRIVAKIEELFTKLDVGVEALKKVKAQLKRYRQAVLKYAFEGKLTEKWREKHKNELEPASLLLEQIREERKKNTKGSNVGATGRSPLPVDTSDFPELPEGWVWTRVGEISQVMGGKRLPKGHMYSETPTNFPYIRVTDFENITVNMKGLLFLRPETQKLISKYTVSKEDLYISIAGSIGKVGIIPEQLDCVNLTENAAKITEISGLEKKFLCYVLNSNFGQNQINRLIVSSNQPKLALFRIEQIIIPLPSLPEQHKIVEEIERRFSVADKVENLIEQSLNQAERLRQSILKRAFEGKLVPQDPTDEPAEKLLERIKLGKKRGRD